ncbi:MAG: alpha/beta hydrolase [Gammaproteobacteria bacterium]|nr:alpha/beta hydrolase [Gammaproteobacteria bacterium]
MKLPTFMRALRMSWLALLTLAGAAAHAVEPVTSTFRGGGEVPLVLTSWGNQDGPGVLLVHGFLGSALLWRQQHDSTMAQTHAMAAFDLRGHGASGKPWNREAYVDTRVWAQDVDAAIRESGLERPVIVAWSYGGYFLMNYLRHYGTSAVSGIVLVGSDGGLVRREPTAAAVDEETAQQRRAASSSPDLQVITRWNAAYVADVLARDGPLPPAEMELLRLTLGLVPHYVRPFLREHRTDNTDLLEQIDVPVLFIHGEKDLSVPLATVREAAGRLQNARLGVYEGVYGHLPFWYWPKRFEEDLERFIAEVHHDREP